MSEKGKAIKRELGNKMSEKVDKVRDANKIKRRPKIICNLKKPKFVYLVPIYAITLILVSLSIYLAVESSNKSVVTSIIYGVSAILLCYSVILSIKFFKIAKKSVVASFWNKSPVPSFLKGFKNRFLLFTGFSDIASIAYAIINCIQAMLMVSSWFWSLAMYYLILAVLRGKVLLNCLKNDRNFDDSQVSTQKNNLRQHLYCGIGLLLTIIALSIAISLMISFGASFRYAGLMIYVAAIYTFTKVIVAIISYNKARKRKNIVVETIRNISLADAVVSVLALQTAMFEAFAFGQDVRLFNALTGGFVCLIIMSLAVYMIIKSIIMIKKIDGKSVKTINRTQ